MNKMKPRLYTVKPAVCLCMEMGAAKSGVLTDS